MGTTFNSHILCISPRDHLINEGSFGRCTAFDSSRLFIGGATTRCTYDLLPRIRGVTGEEAGLPGCLGWPTKCDLKQCRGSAPLQRMLTWEMLLVCAVSELRWFSDGSVPMTWGSTPAGGGAAISWVMGSRHPLSLSDREPWRGCSLSR